MKQPQHAILAHPAAAAFVADEERRTADEERRTAAEDRLTAEEQQRVQRAYQAVVDAQQALMRAQGALDFVGQEVRDAHQLAPGDTFDVSGSIARAAT